MKDRTDRPTHGLSATMPPFSVGQYTTPHLSFADDLQLYPEAGAEGIGVDVGLKLGGRTLLTPAEVEAFQASGLRATFVFPGVTSVLPLGMTRTGPTEPAKRIEAMCQGIRELAVLQPVCFVCGPGPVGDLEPDRARQLAVDGLAEVARAASEVGSTIAIEPLHRTIAEIFSFVTDLPSAISLLEDIGEPNVGVLVDVWHLWDTADFIDHIHRHVDHILGVHVDDWRDPTRSWADRVLPGDGIADVAGILSALDSAGYRGWYELEIFSDDGYVASEFEDSLWKLEPLELLRRGRSKFEDAWRTR